MVSIKVVTGADSPSPEEMRASVFEGCAKHMDGLAFVYAGDAARCLVMAAIEVACLRPGEALKYTRDALAWKKCSEEHTKLAAQARARMVAG